MPTNQIPMTIAADTQRHYAQLLGCIDGIFWEADVHTLQFTYVSEHAAQLLGYPLRQWARPGFWLEHLHADDRSAVVALCNRVTHEASNQSLEYRMNAADGRVLWLRNVVDVVIEAGRVTKLRGLMVDVTARKLAEEERQGHLWFLESMDKVNCAMQSSNDLAQMMSNLLDVVLAIFACDRAWLLYPCDPECTISRVPMERTTSQYPGAHAMDDELPVDPSMRRMFQAVRQASGPVQFGPWTEHPIPEVNAAAYQVQSVLSMAIYPKADQPYMFGLHQCTYPRQWNAQEERLFQAIGQRLGDVLTSLLTYRHLQESELRYREVFENTSDAITIMAVTEEGRFRFLDFNPAWEKLNGISRTLLIDRFLEDLSIHENTSIILHAYRTCCEKRTPIDFEHEVLTPTGRWQMQTTLIPVSNEAGQIYRLVGIGRNITAQKQAEEKLRTSEARFRTFLDHATDAFLLHDAEGVIIDVNQQACASLGYSQEELIGKTPVILDRDAPPSFLEQVGRRLEAGETVSFETYHYRKDGSCFPVEVRTRPFWEDGQRFNVALVQDITERKRAEKARIESHSLLQAVVEGTTDAIFVKDLAGRYLMINAAGAQTLGKRVDEIIGQDDYALHPPESARTIVESDRFVMTTGKPQILEVTTISADIPRTHLATKVVYRDGDGKIIGIIGISRDITELKRLEEQFRQAQKMEAVGRLAGGMAHDFNNLLTVINGYSQLLFNRLGADDPNRIRLGEIKKAGERAANLTRQLLTFSRKQVLQPQVVSLNALLGELIKLLQRLIGEDIDLALSPAEQLGLAKIDPSQFEQAMINLAVNARDAMPQGGQLRFQTDNVVLDEAYTAQYPDLPAGRYVCVMVSDTGIGMNEITKQRIFEPFFTTKEIGKGTGLGLAMVYGFIKQSGGHIEVVSQLGHGTTFKLYLPCAEESVSPVNATQDQHDTPRGTETILLVEDEDAVRNLIRLVLQSSGYTVLEAQDGQEAVWIAEQHRGPIHLLMTDLVMPRMSGRHLADRLTQARPTIHILFMSGYTDETIMHHDELQSTVALLQKPFNPVNLAHKVRAVLDA